MANFLCDPHKIEIETFDKIREQANLEGFSSDEVQIVLHMVRMWGEPALSQKIHFSPKAIKAGKKAIKNYANMLYDVETVQCALEKSLLYQEPMCFIRKASTISQAKASKQSRAMTAVSHWKNYIKGGIAIFGQSSSALMYLLDMIKTKEFDKPALIIATNSGFVNAAEGKQLLRDSYDELGVEYITLEGTVGGSMLAAAAVNALLRVQKGEFV
ncbi:MAG: Precorrin-8X methylmutase [uncultured Thiotrichaceae bacterium]|uniref:Precorrin-8X methylmutase n=1 Tax=uncultured Thiotrichaceae bacterium TaxID=298394 RepID=A0A6S6T5N4_9GAMM|nr:MAG: Precorrin-8X methylmutase [uncultured Thiotrichaceae bacterium]